MQYTQLLTAHKKSRRTPAWFKVVWRMLAMLAVAGLIIWQFDVYGADLKRVWAVWTSTPMPATSIVWVACIVLMILNWSLEAIKWKFLARYVAPLSFAKAFRSVLAGLSLNAVLPHFVGEYAGRIGVISQKHKSRLIGSLWVSHTTQMAITCIAGSIGLAFFLNAHYPELNTVTFVAGGGILTSLVLCGIILILPRLVRLFGSNRIGHFLAAAHQFTISDWLASLSFSALRYLCFSLQFLLLLHLLGLQLPLHLQVAGISWVFLVKSWAPALNIVADLGIREAAALAFFPLFGADPAVVVAASLSVWFLNLFVPSLLGAVSLIRLPSCRYF